MAANEMIGGQSSTAGSTPTSGIVDNVISGPAYSELVPNGWQAFLERAGAVIDTSGLRNFGQPEAECRQALSGDTLADLSHYGLIEVAGEEAQKFLASLFTGDIRLLSPERGQFTAWCDGKGRVIATFWVFMHGGACYLLLPKEMLPVIMKRLRQFLLRVKATVVDVSTKIVRIGISGSTAESRLADLCDAPPPTQVGETKAFGGCTLVSILSANNLRWLAVGTLEAVQSLWQGLQATAIPVGPAAVTLLDTLSGVPYLVTETSGEFLPQMLNLEALGGLCFTKGCYPGQEVIARLQYRGQLKRCVYLAYGNSAEIPVPGTKLYRAGITDNVGIVLSAAMHPDGKIAVLAVVDLELRVQGDIHLMSAEGPELSFVE